MTQFTPNQIAAVIFQEETRPTAATAELIRTSSQTLIRLAALYNDASKVEQPQRGSFMQAQAELLSLGFPADTVKMYTGGWSAISQNFAENNALEVLGLQHDDNVAILNVSHDLQSPLGLKSLNIGSFNLLSGAHFGKFKQALRAHFVAQVTQQAGKMPALLNTELTL